MAVPAGRAFSGPGAREVSPAQEIHLRSPKGATTLILAGKLSVIGTEAPTR